MHFFQSVFGTSASSTATATATAPPSSGIAGRFEVGEFVEYLSSNGSWITAKVVTKNPDGTYVLDCKPGTNITNDKIRKPGGTGAFSVGEMVEYYSESAKKWIPAKVTKVNATGTYDLDCKPNVPGSKIRQGKGHGSSSYVPPPRGASVDGSASTNLFQAPLQLLRKSMGGLDIVPEAAKALQGFGNRKIAVISLCGLSRTGKTFLANMLTDRQQKKLAPFPMDERRNTEGLWVLGVDADPKSPVVAYLDFESFGKGSMDNAQKVLLCTILSSVLILNINSDLTDDTFLALGEFQKLGKSTVADEGSKPSLHWVFHDFAKGLGQDTPAQYLRKALSSAKGTEFSTALKTSFDAASFNKFACTLLKTPIQDSKQLQNLMSLPQANLAPEYLKGVDDLKAIINSQYRFKTKQIAGTQMDCASFVAFLGSVLKNLKSGGSASQLDVKKAWDESRREVLLPRIQAIQSKVKDIMPSTAFQGRGQREGVSLTMTCANLDYNKLTGDSVHHRNLLAKVKETIIFHAGKGDKGSEGLDSSHINLKLSPGSVIVTADVAPSSSFSPSALHQTLQAEHVSGNLGARLASGLTRIPGFAAAVATDGDAVKVVTSAPEMKNVPALPMSDDSLREYFKQQRTERLAEFNNEAAGDEASFKGHLKEMTEALDKSEIDVRARNLQHGRSDLDMHLAALTQQGRVDTTNNIFVPLIQCLDSGSKESEPQVFNELVKDLGRFPRRALDEKLPQILRYIKSKAEEAWKKNFISRQVDTNLAQLTNLSKKSREDADTANEQLRKMDKLQNELQNQLSGTRTELEDCKKEMRKRMDELETLKKELDNLTRSAQSATEREARLERDKRSLEAELNEFKSEFGSLKQRAGDAYNLKETLQNDVREAQLKHLALEKEKDEIFHAFEAYKNESRKYKEEAEDYKEKHGELMKRFMDDGYGKLTNKDRYHSHSQDLTGELKETKDKLDEALRALNSQVDSHKQLMQEELAKKNQKEATVEVTDHAQLAHTKYLEAELHRLEREKRDLEREKENLKEGHESHAKSQDALTRAETQLRDARNEIMRLSKENLELAARGGGGTTEAQFEERLAKHMEQQRVAEQQLRDTLKDMQKKREEDKEQLLQRERDARKKEGELSVYYKEKEETQKKLDNLTRELQEAQRAKGAADGLRNETDKLRKELKELEKASAENLKKRAEDFEKKLGDHEKKLAEARKKKGGVGCFGRRS